MFWLFLDVAKHMVVLEELRICFCKFRIELEEPIYIILNTQVLIIVTNPDFE